jgi:hypothetical protein
MAKKRQPQVKVQMNVLEQINPNAAGIDIGAEEVWVAVPPERDEESVRVFPTFTADLISLAEWLAACGIETVAMEATGVYWIPLFEILEAHGFVVYLVNARHLKNVSGRKSDVLDCQWIQQLHTYGLLNPSFRPPEEIVALRSLVRHREMLVQYRAAHIQHMQKALTQMNLRLTSVLSDITGVTGLKIIRAIVAGERDGHKLAGNSAMSVARRVKRRSPNRWKGITNANTCLPSSKPWNCTTSMIGNCRPVIWSWKPCTRHSSRPKSGAHHHLRRAPKSGARTRPISIWDKPSIA